MALLNGLRVYNITFNEDPSDKEGIDFVSLVDYPAIESNWVAMSKESFKAPLKFGFNADKQILYGPILIPNKPIYRFNEKTGEEFYVVFSEEVVEKLVRKLQRQAKTINLNYQHKKDSQINEAVIQEIWLTGKPDKSQEFGFDLPKNSGFVGVHIGDSKFWNEEIKTGNVLGFSIEGFLDLELKNIIKKIIMEKFITANTDTGMEIKSDAESWASGIEVYTEADGKKTPCATGEYKLESGETLKVTDGKVTEIVPAEEMSEAEATEVIQKAMNPVIEALKTEMRAQKEAYENKLKELETKLSNLPAQKQEKKEEQKKAPTKQAIALNKLGILRKKDKEVTTKK